MAVQSIETIRAEAKARGLKWAAVLAAYDQVKAEEFAGREYANELRRSAWTTYTAATPYAWPFWRIGFATRFGRIVAEADYKRVPGYDVLHQEVARTFPEWSDDDGCERLWAFLMAPYRPLPRRDVMLGRALELATAAAKLEMVPF